MQLREQTSIRAHHIGGVLVCSTGNAKPADDMRRTCLMFPRSGNDECQVQARVIRQDEGENQSGEGKYAQGQLQPISSEGAFAATAVTARVPGVTNTQIRRADALPMLAVTLMFRKYFWR